MLEERLLAYWAAVFTLEIKLNMNHTLNFLMKKFLLFGIVLFVFQFSNAQSADSLSEETHLEYYYCFAMFFDTVYYTNILEFPMDTVSKMPYIEENWTNHIHKVMNREHFIAIVNGPYAKQEYAQDEQNNWETIFNDSINLIKLEYLLE